MFFLLHIYLGKLGAGVEEVGDEVVVDLSEGEVLGAVYSPGHVVTHTRVQTWWVTDSLENQDNIGKGKYRQNLLVKWRGHC